MKVSRCGGATFRAIVKDCPAITKISHELKEGLDRFSDGLESMVYMGNGEVGREDRHGITKDQIFASVEDPFLAFREVIQTEET